MYCEPLTHAHPQLPSGQGCQCFQCNLQYNAETNPWLSSMIDGFLRVTHEPPALELPEDKTPVLKSVDKKILELILEFMNQLRMDS